MGPGVQGDHADRRQEGQKPHGLAGACLNA